MMTRLITVLALYLAGVGAAAQISKIIPVFGAIQSAHDTDLASATLVMSTIGFASIAVGMAAGLMVTRIGLRRAMFAACLLSVLIGLVLPAAPGVVPLVGLRAIESIGHLGIVTAAPALMVSYAPKRFEHMVLGLWATFFGVAFVFSQSLAGWVSADDQSSLFLRLHVLLFLPALTVLALSGRTPPRRDRDGAAPRIRLIPPMKPTPQLFVSLSFLFHAGVFTTLLSFAHAALEQKFGVAPETARTMASLFPLLALVAMFATGTALGFMSSLKILTLGAVVLLAALATIHLRSGWAVGTFGAAFVATGVIQACVFARIGRVTRSADDVSIMNGMFSQFGNLGNLVLPFVFAKAFQVLPDSSFQLILGPAVVSIVVMQLLAEAQLRQSERVAT